MSSPLSSKKLNDDTKSMSNMSTSFETSLPLVGVQCSECLDLSETVQVFKKNCKYLNVSYLYKIFK